MAAADNPFYIQPPNVYQALMSGVGGYDAARKSSNEDAIKQARLDAANVLQQGGDPKNAMAALLKFGDTQGAIAIAHYSHQKAQEGFQQQGLDIQRSGQDIQRQGQAQTGAYNTAQIANMEQSRRLQERGVQLQEEAAKGGKIPPYFRPNAAGTGYEFIPGGPADPAYIHETTKPPKLSITDISKLSEEGGKLSQLGGFQSTFKPEYASGSETKNWIGRVAPDAIATKNMQDTATWWQGYDRYKAVVRHDLYGSALSATEQAQFEKADITPTMRAEAIQKNLQIQKDLVQKAITRKAGAMIQQGHDPNTISQAYGIPLESLGVATKRGAPNVDRSTMNLTSQGGDVTGVEVKDATIPQGAINDLKANPRLRTAFDAHYGKGASNKYLGE